MWLELQDFGLRKFLSFVFITKIAFWVPYFEPHPNNPVSNEALVQQKWVGLQPTSPPFEAISLVRHVESCQATTQVQREGPPNLYGPKLYHQRTAGFSPWFHEPGFHSGYLFLSHWFSLGFMPFTGGNPSISIQKGQLWSWRCDLRSELATGLERPGRQRRGEGIGCVYLAPNGF